MRRIDTMENKFTKEDEEFAKAVEEDAKDYMEFYDKGRNDMKKELFDKGMPCIMGWYDGFVPEFNQEQINELAEKQGINVGDKIRVIIVKDE